MDQLMMSLKEVLSSSLATHREFLQGTVANLRFREYSRGNQGGSKIYSLNLRKSLLLET